MNAIFDEAGADVSEYDLQTQYFAYGVAIVAVDDDELPVRFLEVFRQWNSMIHDGIMGRAILNACRAFTNSIASLAVKVQQ